MTTSIEIICSNCNNTFAYTDAEREFRESRGLTRPEMCPECRGLQRARRNGDLVSLYNRADSFEPFLGNGDTQPRGNGRHRDARQQFTTTCAACGSETSVPFVPRGDRPVYCRTCYNARRGR